LWQHLTRRRPYETALAEYEELEFRTATHDLDSMGSDNADAYEPPIGMRIPRIGVDSATLDVGHWGVDRTFARRHAVLAEFVEL
jgi:hypothetical protein